MPASPAFPWFKPPASPTAPQPPAQTQPAAAARAPDKKFDPFAHALATGQVKPRPSRSRVAAGNAWSRKMLAP